MNNNLPTKDEILKAIARGLQPQERTILLFSLLIIAFVTAFILLGFLLKNRSLKKVQATFLNAFETQIRKLDLTINEIDYLDILGAYLKKPWKKNLLLTNKTTFKNCLSLLHSHSPKDVKIELIRSISRKAGFEIAVLPKRRIGTWKVFPGAPLKVEVPGGILFSAEVTQVQEETFDFKTTEPLPEEDREITVYLIDFSGISGFKTKITSRMEENRFRALHSDIPRTVAWENPEKAGMDDEIIILEDKEGKTPLLARLKQIRPGWLLLEEPSGVLQKGEDIRIFITRRVAGGIWVNGEIVRNSRDKRTLMIKMTHVKSSLT